MDMLREPLMWFSASMEDRLKKNDHKVNWHYCDETFLMSCLENKLAELQQALDRGLPVPILTKASDVANYAMMLADNQRPTRSDD